MYNPNLLAARKTVCKTTEDFRDVFQALKTMLSVKCWISTSKYQRTLQSYKFYSATDSTRKQRKKLPSNTDETLIVETLRSVYYN